MTLSGATTPGKSGPGSDGNEGVLRIPKSFYITGASPSDFFSVYIQDASWWSLISLQRYSRFILQPQLTGQSKKCSLHLGFATRLEPLLNTHTHTNIYMNINKYRYRYIYVGVTPFLILRSLSV